MSTRRWVFGLISIVAMMAAACDSDPVTPPSGNADVRVVNASLTITTFNLSVDDDRVAENVAFGPGDCVVIPSGTRTLTLSANGSELSSLTGNVAAGVDYAVVLWDDEGEPAVATLITDVQSPGAGVNGLRFINISGAAGDVFMSEPTSDPSGAPTFNGLGNEAVTGFLATPVERSLASLFPIGQTTDPIASITLPTLAERIGTIVFVGEGAPEGQTALVFEPCPAP